MSARSSRYSRRVVIVAVVGVLAALIQPGRAYAAPEDVVINELMYSPLSENDGDEFLELRNRGGTPVDLSGWCFGGITLCFASGTTIAANGYLVVARDAARFNQTYGVTADAIYTGGLSNGGETISLRDGGGATIDSVAYLDRAPWPGTPDELGPSLELIDPTQDNNDPVNWAASTATSRSTPKRVNSVNGVGVGPRISAVTADPAVPNANQAVTVGATITDQTSAVVRYRIDFGAEQTVPMQSVGGDAYTATLPGVAAGHLLRYRVEATNAARTSRVPRADDTIGWQGVVARNGVTSAIPVFEWFIADADYNAITGNPTADITRSAVISYNGTVIDNVQVNIRGQGSQDAPKPNWKFEMPRNRPLDFGALLADPVDEFAMQADYSDKSHGRSTLAWDAFATAGVINAQLFQMRTQKNAQFHGLYTYMDLFDNVWREREGYDDKEFFKSETSAFATNTPINVRWEKKNPGDEIYTNLSAFLAGLRLSGNARRDFLLANADVPQMINDAVVTAIVQHTDSSSKNFYFAQDTDTGRWTVVPWDLDHTWGNTCCQVDSPMVTPAETGDKQSQLMTALLAVPEWREMYFRRARTLVNQLLAQGRLEAVYDAKVAPAAPEWLLDRNAWGFPQSLTFNGQRTSLFNAIQARRNAFNNDARVPGNQPAAPNIVINELQHSPVSGDAAEFIELANPGATAIDISGWTLGGDVALEIQPGVVIPAGGRMTFVSDDPAFRSAYSATILQGDTYDGNLAAEGTVTLTRPDGSTADSVAYGGAGWPVATGGPSLSLIGPTLDNADPANWALSAGTGTPGAANGAGPVVTAPGAPTIGTAAAGNASATVQWSGPGNNGGSPITEFQVRVVNNATGQQVGALRPSAAGTTSLLVTGLANGTAYRFEVAATNAVGTGEYSASSNVVTPTGGASVPGAPTIAAPSQGAVGGATTAIARWTLATTNGGSPITGQQVIALRMSSAADDATVINTQTSRVLGPNVKQYDFQLAAGTYRFQVVAINAVGTGPPSARSTAVVPR